MVRDVLRSLGCAMVALCLFTLCPLTPAKAAESWDSVVAAAKTERNLVIYHSQFGAGYFTDAVKKFERDTGIRVRLLDGRATEISERIRSEGASNRRIGDLVFSSTAILQTLEDERLLLPVGNIPNLSNLRESASTTRAPAFRQIIGILVNTDLVSEKDEPRHWQDILDPKWKGKILSNEPRTVGAGLGALGPLWRTFGETYIEALSKQGVTFSRDVRLEERRIAMGEFSMLISEMLAFSKELKDLPVKMITPEPSSPYTPIDMSVIGNAPHPNAARLFINYFLSDPVQLAYAKAGMRPVVKGVIEQLSDADRKLLDVTLMGWVTREDREPGIAVMKKYFGAN
ncbi:MAG: hypothetical protein BGP04_10960 [Rhizobiales bacterium 62-17]|nr:extracellular solute-binding protein [Hyphomicrobiales bacterium]OJY05843.1 MAG: hypothetical protein BGP04_10960 [Rhizobiales bacterium 62-17]